MKYLYISAGYSLSTPLKECNKVRQGGKKPQHSLLASHSFSHLENIYLRQPSLKVERVEYVHTIKNEGFVRRQIGLVRKPRRHESAVKTAKVCLFDNKKKQYLELNDAINKVINAMFDLCKHGNIPLSGELRKVVELRSETNVVLDLSSVKVTKVEGKRVKVDTATYQRLKKYLLKQYTAPTI